MHDVIIIGGGPAGLSAALVLGRCRRRVLVCDSGKPRNASAVHMHGYLTRDRTEPAELQRLGRAEIAKYGVEFVLGEVIAATRRAGGFEIELQDGAKHSGRRLLLATGVTDRLPEIPGVREMYGRSVHHCPYCDGYEHRDQRIVALGNPDKAVGLATSLLTWTANVTACTNGEHPTGECIASAKEQGIPIRTERIRRLVSKEGALVGVELEGGECLPCEAVFFNTGQIQRSRIPAILGCDFNADGGVKTTDRQCTNIPGLYLAGDADKDVQFVIVAAAEGATAAVAINKELQAEDRKRRPGASET